MATAMKPIEEVFFWGIKHKIFDKHLVFAHKSRQEFIQDSGHATQNIAFAPHNPFYDCLTQFEPDGQMTPHTPQVGDTIYQQ